MHDEIWSHRPTPAAGPAGAVLWQCAPATTSELTDSRARLRGRLADGGPAAPAEECLDQLLLAFEELGSNALRHGSPPVEITVTLSSGTWVLDVSDGAPGRQPTPAVDRDPAAGGLGLHLVARLAVAHGWDSHDGRKHVWACIDVVPDAG
ncbi:Histidine kinase-like ATPase domain-containing protein [Geodermatophilus dictyosporus]|uniref:Histidine kinase-like ATPase domain-containing protein n=1 Tax=Geodermatophilus dictyosporus TaxID=1523247 RepID=A0A1I5T3S5_9ACTN|nr:ATP-binding protein [Geodermatophilus dictyosporus]SFP77694.1 Histidine kinase-like ATPase domain-containing protein [Geodermatophilus dictyosporus]